MVWWKFISREKYSTFILPSINKKNLDNFNKKFTKKFNKKPNHLSLLSYDLLGLIYYLSLQNDLSNTDNLFKKKNSFKGKLAFLTLRIIE